MEPINEFVKNLSLLDLLVIVVTVILILVGILIWIVGRNRKSIYWFLGAALLPLFLGLLAMYLKTKMLILGSTPFHLNAEAIEEGRREALIIAAIGAGGTIVLISIGLLRLGLIRRGET